MTGADADVAVGGGGGGDLFSVLSFSLSRSPFSLFSVFLLRSLLLLYLASRP